MIIITPRLKLRLPHGDELAELTNLAGKGVHRPDKRPFLTPWTEGSPESRARFVLQGHWRGLADWRVAAWQLGLAVCHRGRPLGVVTLRAHDFLVVPRAARCSA